MKQNRKRQDMFQLWVIGPTQSIEGFDSKWKTYSWDQFNS